MISIIVPVYKVENVIRRCLDSIVAQTYRNFEAIIVDDGSPDKCGEICDEYALKDSRFKVFHKKNGGLPSARNYGLERLDISSKYVCFLDSDDYVESTWLEDFIKNHNNEDVLIQNSRWWRNNEIMLDRKIQLNAYDNLYSQFESLALKNSLHVWAALWKTSIIRKFNIKFPDFQYWEDVGFCFIYYKYVSSINIIPNDKLHNYNYNYFYPTTYRTYNNLTINWFKVKCSVLDLWIELSNLKSIYHKDNLFTQGIIYDIFEKLLIVYKNNSFSFNDEIQLIKYLKTELSGKYNIPFKKIKYKLINYILKFKPLYSYKILKLLSKL